MDEFFLTLNSPDLFIFNIGALIILGASLGSFSSALIHRIKQGESWIGKIGGGVARSACTQCDHVLGVKDLVPVISWCIQKGRCRYCSKKISKQYILLEIVSIISCLCAFLVFGFSSVVALFLCILPFVLAQIILFIQCRIVSRQLYVIIAVVFIMAIISTQT